MNKNKARLLARQGFSQIIILLVALVVVGLGYVVFQSVNNGQQSGQAIKPTTTDSTRGSDTQTGPITQTPSMPPAQATIPGTTIPDCYKQVYVMGGQSGSSTLLNDVWSSPDLISWTNISPNNPTTTSKWFTRHGHTAICFDNKIWVMGGQRFFTTAANSTFNDVWSSPDGINWTHVDTNLTTPGIQDAPWGRRYDHTSIVFNNRIWVMGGNDGTNQDYNDVWSSSDGATWIQATGNAPWTPRSNHTSVVFGTQGINKMWVIGGTPNTNQWPFSDVWSSVDGSSWVQVTSNASWAPRFSHTSVVFNKKMWVIAGNIYNPSNVNISDVWSSFDGVIWTQTNPSIFGVGNGADLDHTSVVFNNKIWILGGCNWAISCPTNAIYSSPDGITWTQSISGPVWNSRQNHQAVVK